MAERLALAGVFTAIVTPFSSDGSVVDWKALEALVERQIQGGVDGLQGSVYVKNVFDNSDPIPDGTGGGYIDNPNARQVGIKLKFTF